ncbi:hypothetical protein F5X98DRAFT_371297 [Xylaria grammica]|nr:hypothetical protein F5X98DRAFT_371297 [Xylaria grammica]
MERSFLVPVTDPVSYNPSSASMAVLRSHTEEAERLRHAIAVDVVERDGAVDLLYGCTGIPVAQDGEIAVRLVEAQGFLPLALGQACSYIPKRYLDLNGYMHLYTESHVQLLHHELPRAIWSYEETTFTTWEISFTAVSTLNMLAAKLPDVAGFFHSNDVPFALLCPLTQDLQPDQRLLLRDFPEFIKTQSDYSLLVGRMCDEVRISKIRVRQTIGRLVSLPLVHRKTETYSISAHPLAHLWLPERRSDAQRRENARIAISLVLLALINSYDLSRFSNAQITYPYLFACLEHVWRQLPAGKIEFGVSDYELHRGLCSYPTKAVEVQTRQGVPCGIISEDLAKVNETQEVSRRTISGFNAAR